MILGLGVQVPHWRESLLKKFQRRKIFLLPCVPIFTSFGFPFLIFCQTWSTNRIKQRKIKREHSESTLEMRWFPWVLGVSWGCQSYIRLMLSCVDWARVITQIPMSLKMLPNWSSSFLGRLQLRVSSLNVFVRGHIHQSKNIYDDVLTQGKLNISKLPLGRKNCVNYVRDTWSQ